MKNHKNLTALIASLGMTAAAHSAVITWGTSVQMYQGDVSDETFVSTDGTSLVALNGSDGPNDATVNGVTFVGGVTDTAVTGVGGESITVITGTNNNGSFQDGEYDGSNDISALIQGGIWGSDRVDFAGLAIGNVYQIQLFGNDARGNRSTNFIGGVGNGTGSGGAVASLQLNNSPADGSAPTLPQSDVGDYIIGTFTADAVTQSFDVYGTNSGVIANLAIGDSRAHVNAIQLRGLGPAVPEPSSALLALIGLSFGLRRRR